MILCIDFIKKNAIIALKSIKLIFKKTEYATHRWGGGNRPWTGTTPGGSAKKTISNCKVRLHNKTKKRRLLL